MHQGLSTALVSAPAPQPELLALRLGHLNRALLVLLWLMGLGLAISGGIRAVREMDSQPNSSLVVLAIGFGLLVLAASRATSRLFSQPDQGPGLKGLQTLSWQITLVMIAIFLLYRSQVQDLRSYAQLFAEGSVAEWLTFLLFMVSSPLALACGRASWARRERLRAGHHLLFGLGCLVVALEEMSWGQMVFNWPTPELLNQHNAQHETSLHNLHLFQDHLWSGTALVFAGALALALVRLVMARCGCLRPHGLLADLLPGPELLPCLIFSVMIYIPVAVEKAGFNLPLLITRDQEVAELAFGLASMLYITRMYVTQPLRWRRSAIHKDIRALRQDPTG